MSRTFSLVCHDTKQRIWIGQGYEEMSSFYFGHRELMERLRRFFNATKGKNLVLLCDDTDDECFYEEFEEEADNDA